MSSAQAASRVTLDLEYFNLGGAFGNGGTVAIVPTKCAAVTKICHLIHAGLSMTTPPKMRDLAHCLLAYEVVAGNPSEPIESATLRVYEKLRKELGEIAGVAGFQSLASRALALARTEAPSLSAVRVSADGELQGLGQGLGEIGRQIDIDKDRAGDSEAGEGGIILIGRLLGLLRLLLGDALTLSLLRNEWPGATFDDRNYENGRNV